MFYDSMWGECQGQEAGVAGLISKGREDKGWVFFSEREPGKGIPFEMYIKKISNKILEKFHISTLKEHPKKL